MQNYNKWLLPILLTLSLTACASFYDKKVDKADDYHTPDIVDESYNVNGRFSIITQKDNSYGNFTWQHSSQFDDVSLMSPIGNVVAKIIVESNIATLKTSDGSYSGKDLDSLLMQQLGYTLPITYLHYWMQGIPLPEYPVTNKLQSGFMQLGWKVEYLKWQDENHPYIMQISNDAMRIKLLINW